MTLGARLDLHCALEATRDPCQDGGYLWALMGWSELVVGVVAGIVALILWGVVAACIRWWRQRRDFGVLAGEFARYGKLRSDPEPERVKVTIDANVLAVEWSGLPEGDSVKGRISMNEQFRTSGEGHYEHIKNGVQLWGFWKLQKRDAETLLVHTIYADPENDVAVVQGHEWRRIRS